MAETRSRNTVLSVRVDEATAQTLDLLVQAGLAGSRSEAAAQLIAIGIHAATDMLAQARQLAGGLQRLRAICWRRSKRKMWPRFVRCSTATRP